MYPWTRLSFCLKLRFILWWLSLKYADDDDDDVKDSRGFLSSGEKKRNINHLTVHREKKNRSLLWLEWNANDPNQLNDERKRRKFILFRFVFLENKQGKNAKRICFIEENYLIWLNILFHLYRREKEKKKCVDFCPFVTVCYAHFLSPSFAFGQRKKLSYTSLQYFVTCLCTSIDE